MPTMSGIEMLNNESAIDGASSQEEASKIVEPLDINTDTGNTLTDRNNVLMMIMIKEAVAEAIMPLRKIIDNLNDKMDKMNDKNVNPPKMQKQKGLKDPMLKPYQNKSPSYSQQLRSWGIPGQGQTSTHITDDPNAFPYPALDMRQIDRL